PQHTAEELKKMFDPPRYSALQNLQYPFEKGAAWRMIPPQPTASVPTSPWAGSSKTPMVTHHFDLNRLSWWRSNQASRGGVGHLGSFAQLGTLRISPVRDVLSSIPREQTRGARIDYPPIRVKDFRAEDGLHHYLLGKGQPI